MSAIFSTVSDCLTVRFTTRFKTAATKTTTTTGSNQIQTRTERERNTKKETKANHKLLLVVFVSSVHKIQQKQPVGRFCFVVLIKNKTAHAC